MNLTGVSVFDLSVDPVSRIALYESVFACSVVAAASLDLNC